jgi:hypothetical protein
MGINLHLVDQRSPRGFTVAVPRHNPRINKILRMQARLSSLGIGPAQDQYAMQSLIGENDTMAAVVTEITSQYSSQALDAIRIECHGIEIPGAGVFGLRFGQSFNAGDTSQFRRIQPLWSSPYSPVPLGTAYGNVVPRIECHGCAPVHGCNAILQALASAANAPVFASNESQTVHAARGTNPYAFEGAVWRFVPGASARPEQLP